MNRKYLNLMTPSGERLLVRAARYGYPSIPGIAQGEAEWRRFIAGASDSEITAANTALLQVQGSGDSAPVPSGNPPEKTIAVEALTALRDKYGSDAVVRACANVIADYRKEHWAKVYGLTKAEGYQCVWKLTSKKCKHLGGCIPGSWADHPELWLKDKKPFAFTAHPYQLRQEDAEALTQFAQDHSLSFHISAQNAFYFPGRTVQILIMREGDSLNRVEPQS